MRAVEPRPAQTAVGVTVAAVVGFVLLFPGVFVVKAVAQRALATSWWSRWWYSLGAVALAGAMLWFGMHQLTMAWVGHILADVEVGTPWTMRGVLKGLAWAEVRIAMATLPVCVPVGVAAAVVAESVERVATGAVWGPRPELPAPGRVRWEATRARRELVRVDRKAVRALERPRPRQPAGTIGVTAGPGDLPTGWVERGGYLVLPARQARLPRLVVGRPGQGKSVYLCREVYLAGLTGEQAIVADCKGEQGFVREVEDAYLAGWKAGGHPGLPSVHRWPEEPLNAWTGGPEAVANRLLSVWTFDTPSLWYREIVEMALNLALQAPGPPVTSSRAVLERVQPDVLAGLWANHPEELSLVRSVGQKLDDVNIRLGNLLTKLGGLLDGERALGESDLAILSLPTMGQEHQAESLLRVALADLAHYVASRKPRDRKLLIVVDEFSAIPAGRQHAIHLAERGRSAGAAVVLAVQSARGLGDDNEADRIIGAVGMVACFAVAEPERILRLAGTIEKTRQSLTMSERPSATYTPVVDWRVDANDVRALEPGFAYVLAAGRAQKIKVVRAPGWEGPRPAGAAAGNPAPSDGPALSGEHRGLPSVPTLRQGQALPPPASLDPGPARPVRRHRPPPASGDHPRPSPETIGR